MSRYVHNDRYIRSLPPHVAVQEVLHRYGYYENGELKMTDRGKELMAIVERQQQKTPQKAGFF